ncbi:hypothetical protein P170DRAFT_188995 [Aspergillus steynii IBT 23096]|uniref:Uncharacterized protein n=1 Tax=Aspergillus steynii IBT 23096 TaxID=1392250 RepID=A0A2I2G9N0_9EURO|nr:uncharacterized protein P170DRAFT_188995 [Aspergillus steynii IBT 23096]PLB49585.1 hypothetical protein P170DRAFT_188995 [Aspergillus steynii IBT 23096]
MLVFHYLPLSMSSPKSFLFLRFHLPPFYFLFVIFLLGSCYAYDTPNRIVHVLFFFRLLPFFYPWAGILRKVHQVQIELCSALRIPRHAFLLDRPVQHCFVPFLGLPASRLSIVPLRRRFLVWLCI